MINQLSLLLVLLILRYNKQLGLALPIYAIWGVVTYVLISGALSVSRDSDTLLLIVLGHARACVGVSEPHSLALMHMFHFVHACVNSLLQGISLMRSSMRCCKVRAFLSQPLAV